MITKPVKIYISELGGIRDTEIELKPFMIYTGDSGLGKSYTSLLVYYFQKTLATQGRLIGFIDNKMNNLDGDSKVSFSFMMKEFRQWLNEGVSKFLGYMLGYDAFTCRVTFIFDIDDNEKISIECSEDDRQNLRHILLNGEDYYFPKTYGNIRFNVTNAFSQYLCKIFYGKEMKIPLVFPPARAAFASSALGDTSSIGMYSEFISCNNILASLASSDSSDDQLLSSMLKNLIGGELIRQEGNLYLKIEGVENAIPISAAASSIKELLPMFLLLKNRMLLDIFQVLFEEPEAHVHPCKQYVVADMIARCFNNGTMFQMTTHSDYLLSRINQLIRLGNIRRADKELFDKYCVEQQHNKNLFLSAENIGAYYFMRSENGQVKVISLDTTNGIDLKSFEGIVNKQLRIDALIGEYEERLQDSKIVAEDD